MNLDNGVKVLSSMVFKLFCVACMFALAWKYDGNFVWAFLGIAGGIIGFDLNNFMKGGLLPNTGGSHDKRLQKRVRVPDRDR